MHNDSRQRLLRLPDVLKIIPVSRSTWYAGMREGLFPKPVKLGRSVLWREEDVMHVVQTEVQK